MHFPVGRKRWTQLAGPTWILDWDPDQHDFDFGPTHALCTLLPTESSIPTALSVRQSKGAGLKARGACGEPPSWRAQGLSVSWKGKENKEKKTRLQQHVSGWYNVCGWYNSRAQAKFFSLIWCDWLLSKSLTLQWLLAKYLGVWGRGKCLTYNLALQSRVRFDAWYNKWTKHSIRQCFKK